MKSIRHALMLSVLVLLGACATQPVEPSSMPTDAEVEQYNASVPPEERIICREETPVGSNIPRRLCRYVVDVEENSRFTRQELGRALR